MLIKKSYLLFTVALLITSCSTTGKVEGTLCFPSEYIPAMNVYLKEVANKKIYRLENKENQRSFRFAKLAEGNYVAYAYTQEALAVDMNNKKIKTSGGYTQAVPCGLTASCKDHSLITFKVSKGKTTKDVKICDWYGAIVPSE
ncbi:MAG TPA: hypothetical protein DGG95_08490 [Cytophagales bacterium]|jgi:hypothetical protein|nr:hypothetical protein [Cytophagales bacterium]